jgi:hypothetical protein
LLVSLEKESFNETVPYYTMPGHAMPDFSFPAFSEAPVQNARLIVCSFRAPLRWLPTFFPKGLTTPPFN